MAIILPQRGTYDAYYDDALNLKKIEHTIDKITHNYGYSPIIIPMYEAVELFSRSAGESSDIVTKEMFDFVDKGGRHIALRPELTAGVMRAIVTNKLYANYDLPLKLSYCGQAFRYERPQAGRFRQLTQYGIENVGVTTPEEDAEAIILGYNITKKLGFGHVILKINSIGDQASRDAYRTALRGYFKDKISCMCQDCQRRYEINPLRILDCKVPEDQKIAEGAPKMGDYLNDESKQRFKAILKILDENNIEYVVDDTLVRGLDYYSHIVFEFHYISSNGTNLGAIGAGGHYDNLVKEVGGPELSSVGFAFGLDRLNLLLKEINPETYAKPTLDVFVMYMGERCRDFASNLANKLRNEEDLACDLNYTNKSFKASFKIAVRKNAKWAVIIGEDEINKNVYQLKNLQTQEQVEVNYEDLIKKIKE